MATKRSLATIFSGADETVKLRDGSDLKLRIHQLPARKHIEFITLTGNEAELIEFSCTAVPGEEELEKGWADALTDEAHLYLINIVKELNFQRATVTLDRTNSVAKALMPHRVDLETSTT